ncbi:chlorocatechol 1,2-dioxygenase [Cupriavidus sp. DF5525]|uniref:chlorocatechol 1,2-dioxygenase n=1 Tax=Cupriavidus sp. DF5525 TaxID=3160989 RepID=UPI0035A95611
MDKRVAEVAGAIVEAVRKILLDKRVTEAEYRAGVDYLTEVAQTRETALLLDVFLNSTIIEGKAQRSRTSAPAIQGPYFLEGAPVVEGVLKTYDNDDHKPLIIRGTVRSDTGELLAGAVIDVWHSTPDGLYSGIHDNIPVDYYRGKLVTDSQGNFRVRTTMPVPYQIPSEGPTGRLLGHLGSHTWRPAHVHFKVRKDGFEPLTTQYYFEGGKWVDDDCCHGVTPDLITPETIEDGVRVMTLDFVIEREQAEQRKSATETVA